jgi:DNA-binding response OmpR family regulator
MTDTVLLIEDEADISLAIKTLLGRAGFTVHWAANGRDGIRRFHELRPDAVILDVGLPDLDGWQVLERVRDLSNRPVLLLTAHGTDADKVRGLRGGADDYLTKPFSNAELVARVHALIRRSRVTELEPVQARDVLIEGALQIRLDDPEVLVNGAPVALTPLEFRLISALAQNRDRVLTSEQLLRTVWDDWSALAPDRVKFAVLRLRRKLGPAVTIESVRGFGYRLRSQG